jgi:hypothetical protein
LTTLSAAAVTTEMTQLETAFMTILGKTPTYMRPPFFAYNNAVLAQLKTMQYHVIICDIDTLDWQNDTPQTIGQSVTLYQQGIAAGGTISLSHDVYQTTGVTLVAAMLKAIKDAGKTCKSPYCTREIKLILQSCSRRSMPRRRPCQLVSWWRSSA